MTFTPNRAEDRLSRSGVKIDPGPFEAIVMENADPQYTGRLSVWISSYGGDINDSTSWITVRCATPFYGITPYSVTKELTQSVTAGEFRETEGGVTSGEQDGKNRYDTTKSFGMWTQPPEIGTRVLVVFANNDMGRGYWIAAIPELAHGMIPGVQPKGEFDPASSEVISATDLRQVPRPNLADVEATYSKQGLSSDPLRGVISSSSMRESPSRVFGFSTPSNHSFVMDDGDRYGQSKLIRIRTGAGNQITMHDDTGMVYITNAGGTGWLELSPSGQIDVYGSAGINLATEGDINLHANKNVNIHAGENLKMVAGKGAKLQGTEELQLHGKKTMIEGVDSLHLHSCQEIIITSFKDVFLKAFNWFVLQGKCFRWNSGAAKEAEQVPPEQPTEVTGYQTTVARAPSKEPYKQHDGGGQQGSGASQTIPSGVGAVLNTLNSGGNVATAFSNGIRTAAETAGNGFVSMAQQISTKTATAPVTSVGGNAVAKPNTGNVAVNIPTTSTTGGKTVGTTPTTSTSSPITEDRSSRSSVVDAASSALANLGSMGASSNIPAGQGGGATGFAKGNNCERPVDETGGNGGQNGEGNGAGAQPGQKSYTPPEALKNDPEFQAKLAEMKAKYPGLSDQQIYNVVGGESGFNWKAVNGDSGATGGFQFIPSTAKGLGYTTAQIQAMSPAQQLSVYDKYLSSNGYRGGPLGIMQAAPAFANRPGNTIVYPVGSTAWRQNPGWRGPDGTITVDSINRYYGY